MGDFSPDRLDSRSLETLWAWKNRVLIEEYYILQVMPSESVNIVRSPKRCFSVRDCCSVPDTYEEQAHLQTLQAMPSDKLQAVLKERLAASLLGPLLGPLLGIFLPIFTDFYRILPFFTEFSDFLGRLHPRRS